MEWKIIKICRGHEKKEICTPKEYAGGGAEKICWGRSWKKYVGEVEKICGGGPGKKY